MESALKLATKEQSDAAIPYRVGLDLSALNPDFKAHSTRGIGRYVRELWAYLSSHTQEDLEVGSFEHDKLVADSFLKPVLDWSPLGKTTLRQQLIYPSRLNNKKVCPFDVIHFPAHMDPPAWGLNSYIVTVLDIIPLVLSDLYQGISPGWRYKLARFLELQAIKNASMIIAISECTSQDLQRVLNIPAEKIVVTPLGVDKKFFVSGVTKDEIQKVLTKYKIPQDRELLLYVGGIDPRKNMLGLLSSFKIIRDKRDRKPLLVLAGDIENDKMFPDLKLLIKKHDLEADVLMPGFIPDKDLLVLYKAVKLFLFPSLYEGFGFTPLEAMAAGVPVVSSNRSSMPEVLGDAALLVDPEDYRLIADGALAILSSKQLSESLSASGRARAALFPWSRTGEETLKAYHKFSLTN